MPGHLKHLLAKFQQFLAARPDLKVLGSRLAFFGEKPRALKIYRKGWAGGVATVAASLAICMAFAAAYSSPELITGRLPLSLLFLVWFCSAYLLKNLDTLSRLTGTTTTAWTRKTLVYCILFSVIIASGLVVYKGLSYLYAMTNATSAVYACLVYTTTAAAYLATSAVCRQLAIENTPRFLYTATSFLWTLRFLAATLIWFSVLQSSKFVALLPPFVLITQSLAVFYYGGLRRLLHPASGQYKLVLDNAHWVHMAVIAFIVSTWAALGFFCDQSYEHHTLFIVFLAISTCLS